MKNGIIQIGNIYEKIYNTNSELFVKRFYFYIHILFIIVFQFQLPVLIRVI